MIVLAVVATVLFCLLPLLWEWLKLDVSRSLLLLAASMAPLGLLIYKVPQYLPLAFLPFVPVCLARKSPGRTFFVAAVLFFMGVMVSFFYSQFVGGCFEFGYWDIWVPATMLLGASLYSCLSGNPNHRRFFFFSYASANALLASVVLVACLAASGLRWFFVNRLGVAIDLNPNILAGILDTAFPVTLGFGFAQHARRERIFLLVAAAIDLTALLLTQSRGSLLALIAGAVVAIFFLCRKKRTLILFIGVVAIFLAVPIASLLANRMALTNPQSSISNLGRLVLLGKVKKVLAEQDYVYGIGMNHFSQVKMDFGFTRWFDPKAQMSSHNIHLEFLLGWGALGLAGWLFSLTTIAVCLFRQGARGDWLAFGGFMATVAIFIHGFVDSLLVLPLYFVNICVLFGALMAYKEAN